VAWHSFNLRHDIKLQNTNNLSKKSRYMDGISQEVTEIQLHPNNMNMEGSFCISKS
jgi:hypothetical protein